MSSQVNISIFPMFGQKCKVVSICHIVEKEAKKVTLVYFSKTLTLGILMMYFVSCLEMEIKYMCLLNNAQYTTL